MLSITPCRRTISDRFPVASFVVHVPPQRLFEIACATDPQLFRPERRGQRTPENFYSSRAGGLMRAPAGQATYLLPPEQLRRFAGQRRVYFSMASFGDAQGGGAEFTTAPLEGARAPYLSLSPDFTGKSLDRSRLLRAPKADARYGSAAALTWGGDAFAAPAPRATAAPQPYDDGYPAELWGRPEPRLSGDPADPADPPDPEESMQEPPGYEDAPSLRAAEEAAEYGRRSYGGAPARKKAAVPVQRATLAPEPPGLEHPAPQAAAAYGRGTAQVRRAAAPAEPPGVGDPAELHRNRPVFGGAPRTTEPAGAEHPAGLRTRPRYGDVNDLQQRLATRGDLAGRDFAGTSAFSPPGVDDQYDDLLGPDPEGELPPAPLTAEGTLSILDKFRIAQPAAQFESGPEGYAAINADGEFNDASHAAYQRKHYGLHWGLAQFNQRSGALGRVLTACERRDPMKFREVFGAERDELLRVTTAADEESRLAPVGGALLWQEPWLSRFRTAGQVPEFQAAQNEVLVEGYVDPNLSFADALGLNSDRALAMLCDRVVDLGNLGGRAFIIDAVTPLKDAAALSSALAAVGHDSPQSFQRSLGLAESPALGPKAHAALLKALRALGSGAPVQVPVLPQMLDALVTASSGRRFEERVSSIRTMTGLSDNPRQAN